MCVEEGPLVEFQAITKFRHDYDALARNVGRLLATDWRGMKARTFILAAAKLASVKGDGGSAVFTITITFWKAGDDSGVPEWTRTPEMQEKLYGIFSGAEIDQFFPNLERLPCASA